MERKPISLAQCLLINFAIIMSFRLYQETSFTYVISCVIGATIGTIIGYYIFDVVIRVIKRIHKNNTLKEVK